MQRNIIKLTTERQRRQHSLSLLSAVSYDKHLTNIFHSS